MHRGWNRGIVLPLLFFFLCGGMRGLVCGVLGGCVLVWSGLSCCKRVKLKHRFALRTSSECPSRHDVSEIAHACHCSDIVVQGSMLDILVSGVEEKVCI